MMYMNSISSDSSELGSGEQPVKSPCISICALDNEGVCSGCFRTGDEIRSWGAYTNTQRLGVLNVAHEREKKVNPFL
jgi:predicted Fe-S protein YdhL (DUF1289 family)